MDNPMPKEDSLYYSTDTHKWFLRTIDTWTEITEHQAQNEVATRGLIFEGPEADILVRRVYNDPH